nr:MAG TPA: hypothetical protein [Caudoviricetes sp.]
MMCNSPDFLCFWRVARVGGNSNNGANDGLWYWNLNNASSNANWNCGARVFIFEIIIYMYTSFSSALAEN